MSKKWWQKYSIVSRYTWYGAIFILIAMIIYGVSPKQTFKNVTSNEKIIKKNLISIYNAQMLFMERKSRYATSLKELNGEGLISKEIASRGKLGYIFGLMEDSTNTEGFVVLAIPQTKKDRKMAIDQTGKVTYLK